MNTNTNANTNSKSILNDVLCIQNKHPRDKHIQFFEKEHKYIIDFEPNIKYTSVTTWVHEDFEKFDADKIITKMMSGKGWKEGHKYWGMTPSQIKAQWDANRDAVAGAGTDLHFEIECFHNNSKLYNNPNTNTNNTNKTNYTNKELLECYLQTHETKLPELSIEWQYFINFIKDHQHLKPYRTEWTVFNEDIKISGSIDMIYENPDGTLSIYDWKRSKNITRINQFNKFGISLPICHLPDSNFWHYALQLNIYKYILETKYEKKVKELYLVRLHPNAVEKNYELIQLPILSREIDELVEERMKKIM
jgi:ATP-dependent exoDNAse (exonuclease V) beta subunit